VFVFLCVLFGVGVFSGGGGGFLFGIRLWLFNLIGLLIAPLKVIAQN
jgi:hypothetical protein